MRTIDYRVKSIVPMISLTPDEPSFEAIIYGYRPEELMVVPAPEPVQSLARRYPNHQSSMFLVR